MKKTFYPLVLFLFAGVFTACENDDVINRNLNEVEPDIKTVTESETKTENELSLRALSLGYSDTTSYTASTWQKCLANNHTNCDVLADGSHQPCIHASHSGTRHDGTPYNGTGGGINNHHSGNTNNTHDIATCTDASHNHGNNAAHDINTCTDASHNHNANNKHNGNSNKHNNGGHH
jgi:hypothetical protein